MASKEKDLAILKKASINRVQEEQLEVKSGATLKDYVTAWDNAEISTRVTIYLPKALDRKMRFMAWREDRAIKLLYTEAVQHYVTKWEEIKGEIDI